MGPVPRHLVMFESFLRAEAFSHCPMPQMAVMALGKQCLFSDQTEAAVLGVGCVVFACQTCKLDM